MKDYPQFKDLVARLEKECNFHKEGETTRWTCRGTLFFTEQYCQENGADFSSVKALLEANGGFCDCEVLFNSVGKISGNTFLPRIMRNRGGVRGYACPKCKQPFNRSISDCVPKRCPNCGYQYAEAEQK